MAAFSLAFLLSGMLIYQTAVGRSETVITHWIDLADTHLENYDQVWLFRPDGTAVAAIDLKKAPMPADILGAIPSALPYGNQH